ncbi:ISL3 family transposase [Lactobacillus sp. ESL0791]|uniref:ISL3 family transposase n=1 Tax=Lactobacillus sp. ESL0791 TaxID=2983234 RepID=UPI0023F626BD|nr:ISL3 family transposase [Lactobacillus sp. ESL0791]MDF7638485.1 ISL3 family transposase [Lactobacillus sp. ESL0791]
MSSLDDYSTKLLLDIKDNNLVFSGFYLAKDHVTKVLIAELILPITSCPNCHDPLVHNGHCLSHIHYLAFDASKPIQIELHKQRLYCRTCHRSFMATSPLINKHCFIANPVKQKVINDLTVDRSMKDIACSDNVSSNTVLRTLIKFKKQPQVDDYDYLPEHIGVDEFRGVNRQLHFICVDGDSHQIIKILPTRLKKDIMAFFEKFPLIVRSKVKTVTMDLNAYYQDIAHALFPNAQVIIDRFHIVQMLNRSFNQLRVQTMKRFDHRDRRYILLKYYWKSYLTPYNKLEVKRVKYYKHLRDCMTQEQIVEEGLDASPKLRAAYDLMQTLRQSLTEHDSKQMAKLLKSRADVGGQMKTTLKTFKRNLHLCT